MNNKDSQGKRQEKDSYNKDSKGKRQEKESYNKDSQGKRQEKDSYNKDSKGKRQEKDSYNEICLCVGCLTSQQHVSLSQGRICLDKLTCCHTEIEVADQTFYLTHSQYTDTGPTSPSADPITPGAWQGSHWSANV